MKKKSLLALSIIILFLFCLLSCDSKPAAQHTLFIQIQGEGAVEPASGSSYDKDALAALKVFPNEGWVFRNWLGEHGHQVTHLQENMFQLLMDEDKWLEALFEEEREMRTLTIEVQGEGDVHVDPDPDNRSYEDGSVVFLAAIAAEGFVFHGWVGDVEDRNDPKTTLLMDGDKNIIVVFAPTIESIVASNGTIEVHFSSPLPIEPILEDFLGEYRASYEIDRLFQWELPYLPTQPIVLLSSFRGAEDLYQPLPLETLTWDGLQQAQLTFEPFLQQQREVYYQLRLSYGKGEAMVADPFMVSPKKTMVELTIEIEGEGVVSPEEGKHLFEENAIAPIIAEPAPGFFFRSWEGDVEDQSSPETTVLMDRDKSIKAIFISSISSVEAFNGTIEVHFSSPLTEEPLLEDFLGEYRIIDSLEDVNQQDNRELPYLPPWKTILFEVRDIEKNIFIPLPLVSVTWDGLDKAHLAFDPFDREIEEKEYQVRIIYRNGDPILAKSSFTVPPEERFSLTIEVDGEGYTTPVAGTYFYTKGSAVDLEATPSAEWLFSHWEGKVKERESSKTTVYMDQDKVVKAIFKEDRAFFLEPGALIITEDGVQIGALEGSLKEELPIYIKKAHDLLEEIPLPEHLKHLTVIGDFYEISASIDYYSPNNPLLLGLPVPEGIRGEELALLLYTPLEWILATYPLDDPSYGWSAISGLYDPETNLYGAALYGMLTTPQGVALALGAEYSVEAQMVTFGGFHIDCVGFDDGECKEEHKEILNNALEDAYNSYVDRMGFRQPLLRLKLLDISFDPLEIKVGAYLFELRKGRPNGGYNPITLEAYVTFEGSPSKPNKITAHHELFHAIQNSYGFVDAAIKDGALWGIIEGTAVAAEDSLEELKRASREIRSPLLIGASLFQNKIQPDRVSFDDYRSQEFWVYVGKKMMPDGQQLDFLISLLERGWRKKDIDRWLKEEKTFTGLSDAYWQWAKDYSLEKKIEIGRDDKGDSIPKGQPGEWWEALGREEDQTETFQRDAAPLKKAFSLDPLSSRVFRLEFKAANDKEEYLALADIKTSDPYIMYRFYDGSEESYGDWNENKSYTARVKERDFYVYALVSNTHLDTASSSIQLIIEDVLLEEPGEKRSEYVNDIAINMRLARGATYPTYLSEEHKSRDDYATVEKDFYIAETPVTYELWYTVRRWAIDQGYTFAKQGNEGNGYVGRSPTDRMKEPVTGITWYDAIVWCNALSEFLSYEPVYYYGEEIYRDATDSIAGDQVAQTDSYGFRLPTKEEWGLAARYQGRASSFGAIEHPAGSGKYWTPGNYASGATGPAWYNNWPADVRATKEAAWYRENSDHAWCGLGQMTMAVGQKPPSGNVLGLFDMSGNVWEWCFTEGLSTFYLTRIIRGGSYNDHEFFMMIAKEMETRPQIVDNFVIGMRLVTSYNLEIPQFYTLTIEKSGEGAVEPKGAYRSYSEGETVSLRAIPSSGWVFKEWEGEVADRTSPETTVLIDGHKTVKAIFKELPTTYYWLTIELEGDGYVAVNPEPTQDGYLEGSVVTIRATAKAGWQFKAYEGDVDNGESPSITIVMNEDKAITAIFEELAHYELHILLKGEGHVAVDPAPTQNGHPEGSVVTIRATAKAGWQFKAYEGDVDNGESPSITVVMNEDKTITAIFEELYYTLSTFIKGQGSVEEDPLPSDRGHRAGSLVSITAAPLAGWEFIRWEGQVNQTNENQASVLMDNDKEVTAVFESIDTLIPNYGEQRSYRAGDIEFFMRLAFASLFPMGFNDLSEGRVDRNFWIAETQITYMLWYFIRLFAEEQGFVFANLGSEGSQGIRGSEPTERRKEPVTRISWYDAIIWCNALSIYLGLEPVYTYQEQILKDATRIYHSDVERNENRNGFALPTNTMWELAARLKGSDNSYGAIEYPVGSGRYWSPGNYASGAYADYTHEETTKEAAWYSQNSDREGSGQKTQDVGQKPPRGNGLGLFDMSGNVLEWCFDTVERNSLLRVIRGGSFFHDGYNMQVGLLGGAYPNEPSPFIGFRIVQFDPNADKYVILTMSREGEGQVRPSLGEHQYLEGSKVFLEATAAMGFEFIRWEGDVDDPTNEKTWVTMDRDKAVKAIFEPILLPPNILSPGADTSPGEELETKRPLLQWEAVEEASFYSLAIREEPYGLENVVYHLSSVEGITHQVPDRVLENHRSYSWSVQAHNAKGKSPLSNTLYFTTPSVAIEVYIENTSILPSSPKAHEVFSLEMTFINTGSLPHTFFCQVNLWEPGSDFDIPSKVLEEEVSLNPGQVIRVTWNEVVALAGDWGYQFKIFKEKSLREEGLLAQEPSTIGFFAVKREPGEQASYRLGDVEFTMRSALGLTFPTGEDDTGSSTVPHSFWIAETQVTYELWYTVWSWAVENGYTFYWVGMEGSHGNFGRPPSHKGQEPVTYIDWFSSLVWCNALSELLQYDPVYIYQGEILRDATDTMIADAIVLREGDGFRLPTSDEWELAARYRGRDSSFGAIEHPQGSGYYWAPGNYASGAKGPYTNEEATKEAAWYRESSDLDGDGNQTQNVGQKPASGNLLGLFDMSGNVREWCFDAYYIKPSRIMRGGSFFDSASLLQVGLLSTGNPMDVTNKYGLRLARSND